MNIQVKMNQHALLLRTALLLLMMMYMAGATMDIIAKKRDILVGEEILLLCKAGGEGEITWQKDGDDITDSDIFSKVDESSSRLSIKTATLEDAGRYTCLCEFDSGHTANTVIQLYVYEGPSFGHTTTYHEFLEGTDGIVPCVVTGKPAVDVSWLRNEQALPFNEGAHVRQLSDNSLVIKKVKREDAGTYVCRAQIRKRSIFHQLPISVVVNVPPSVTLKEEEKRVLAGPETNVTLLCLVDGHPKPTITWTMPITIDTSRHQLNSDGSQLVIRSVTRADYGEYVCTATNKIAESSATIMLHVFEAPGVFLSADKQRVSMGQRVSVSCNISGHPQPELHWLNKHNGQTLDSTSGRVYVVEGELVIEDVMPSDGGLYSCMAVSTSGNASRDFALHTQPDMPHYLSVSSGPASVHFSLKILPINGGTPITSFVLQWRETETDQWKEVTVPVSDPLTITSLKQYTSYKVRLAAVNAVGMGQFSSTNTVRTQGLWEPDSPVLSLPEMIVESNNFSIPLQQVDEGGTPLQHFKILYRKEKEGAEWTEMQLSPKTVSLVLQNLSFGTDYQVEVRAVNANGSSIPATFNFTIGEQPVSRSMTKGTVVGIVIFIFLVVFLIVDATCCYRNHCGLLMSIAVKIFGPKVPGLKTLENAEGTINGELKGISTPSGSLQLEGVQSKDSGHLTEVTCDKLSLTKYEKMQAGRDLPIAKA